MALSATFKADFQALVDEAKRADLTLVKLGETGKRVGPDMDRVVGKAPEEFSRFGQSAGSAGKILTGTHDSLKAFDDVLDVVGVNLGPIPKAFQQLGEAAGQTASELGALGTAGLAVGAAMGGWQVGRWIADLAGTDEIIGNVTARLLGWGDVAKEEAAAAADTLAIASKKAGREITDMGEAIKVNTEAAFVPYTERIKLAEGELARLTTAEIAEIDSAQRLGASTKDITEKFKVSEGALKLLGERTRDKEKADREAEKAAEKHADAVAEVRAASEDWRVTLESVNPALREQIKQALEGGASQGALAEAYGVTANQIRAVTNALKEEEAAADRAAKAHEEWAQAQVSASQKAGELWEEYNTLRVQQTGTTTDQQIAEIDRWKRETVAKLQEAGEYNEETYTAIEAVAKAKLDAIAIDWELVNQSSKRTLEQTAEKAHANYQYINDHSDQFTAAQIADAQRIRDETRAAVDAWGMEYVETFNEIKTKSQETANAIVNDIEAATGRLGAGSNPLPGLGGTIGNVNPATGEGMEGTDPAVWNYLQQGYTLGEAIALASGHGHSIGAPRGHWTAQGWRAGTGSPGGAIRPTNAGAGGLTLVNNITQPLGTPSQIADAVSAAVMAKLRAQGVRLPA